MLLRGEIPEQFSYGYGYGYGDGYGYGSGDGSGYGYGYGYGYGDGSGYGSGYGYGYGYGYGDGSGYGSKAYWLGCIDYFADKWPESQRARLAECRDLGIQIAYWRSDASGRACNGGRNKPVEPGTVEEIAGPLELCGSSALHATVIPPKWKGDRWWVVAMHGDVAWSDDKCGSLKREVLGECQ